MKPKYLILKFSDNNREFYFENKVIVLEDKKLIENLRSPNIKNNESLLLIKSLNNIHISDVVQIKVKLEDTGHFLISFKKDDLDENKRKNLLNEISLLKNKKSLDKYVQTEKIKKLIAILNRFKPIYASFENSGNIKIDLFKLSQNELKFPIFVLTVPKKRFAINFKKSKKNPGKHGKINKMNEKTNYFPMPIFSLDYFFIFLFSLFGTFAYMTAIFEFMNKQGIAVFLLILALAFTFVLILSMQSTIYHKGKLRNPFIRYYMILYIVLGIAGGIVGSYFISKYVFKTEIADFDYKKLIIMSSLISVVALLSSVSTSRIANLIVKKRKQNKRM